MREILFRGKLKATGEWSFGNLNVNIKGVCIITPDETVVGKYGQVDPETVGQYTGLTDKNGKKIFEGDIVKCSDVDDCYYAEEKTEFVGVIKFEAGAFGIATKETLRIALDDWCENDNFVSLWELEWNEYIGNVEVIGNIHDNPELLKEGADNG